MLLGRLPLHRSRPHRAHTYRCRRAIETSPATATLSVQAEADCAKRHTLRHLEHEPRPPGLRSPGAQGWHACWPAEEYVLQHTNERT